MDLNKAIISQNKSYKRFICVMCFIFCMLPLILYWYDKFSEIFYIIYVTIIELLIILSILNRVNRENLHFEYTNNRLKIRIGIIKSKLRISCDRIEFVHVEPSPNVYSSKDFKIIIISNSKFRSEKMIRIDYKFLKTHSYAGKFYTKLKKMQPQNDYYYTIISRGGLKKYYLLDTIYRTCVYAHFSEECIEKIKNLRQEIDIDS